MYKLTTILKEIKVQPSKEKFKQFIEKNKVEILDFFHGKTPNGDYYWYNEEDDEEFNVKPFSAKDIKVEYDGGGNVGFTGEFYDNSGIAFSLNIKDFEDEGKPGMLDINGTIVYYLQYNI